MTRFKNVKGHPPSYGKPWNQKVHLALPKLVCLKEKKLYLKILKLLKIFTTFLLQWQNSWLTDHLKDQYIAPNNVWKTTNREGAIENYFHFPTIIQEEIENLLNGLTASKATGEDGLPASFLKDGAEVIACPLCHIINLSLHSTQIPEDMKNARVVPLYKKWVKLILEST